MARESTIQSAAVRGLSKSRVCAVLCDVTIEQKEKPIEIKIPEPKEEKEEADEEAAAAEGEEAAPAEEAEPAGPVYFPAPGYGFLVVQNAAGGSEQCVEAGYTKIGAVAEFVETGEVRLLFVSALLTVLTVLLLYSHCVIAV